MKTTTIDSLKKAIAGSFLPGFRGSISGKACSIIAEVKCASPSRGRLVEDFDAKKIAGIYEQHGASAISVLTDEKYFSGHRDYLTQIRRKVQIPVLRKRFHH